MRHIRDDRFVSDQETSGADTPVTPQKDLVTGVHYLLGATRVYHVDRLHDEEDIMSSGKRAHHPHCQFDTSMSIARAHALARYIRRSLSLDQIDESVLRRWRWNERESLWPEPSHLTEAHPYGSPLVDGVCMVFPTRCRTRFVASHAFSCWAINGPHAP